MDSYFKANKDLWNEWAEIHNKSEFYDVKGFLRGKQTLHEIELKELGDIKYKRVLHLMCHFGMDTLSLARLGANVTGTDFSENAIKIAKELAKEINYDKVSNFICCNIYELKEYLDEKESFDIVFTSAGVLSWLPDLQKWAEIINYYLKPGGFFYIREFHPVFYMFSNDEALKEPKLAYNYFQEKNKPEKCEILGSYADRKAKTNQRFTYEWNYPISSIINNLIKAGLRIEFFNEFPYCTYQDQPFMIENEKGHWVNPPIDGKNIEIPMMFSLKATKNI